MYKKSGNQSKALDLCFSARLFDALQSIADELDTSSDPALLARCAAFFEANGELAKAVRLLVMARDIDGALDLCAHHDVLITGKSRGSGTGLPLSPQQDVGHQVL